MPPTIGTQLREAREAQNLSLEDVRHRARIPLALIAALEEDRVDAFASLTYARKFLQHYGRFLRVDVSAHLARFAPDGLSSVAYFRYLQPSLDTTGPATRRARTKSAATPSTTILATLGLLLVAGLGTAMWFGREKQRQTAQAAALSTPAPGKPAQDTDPLPAAVTATTTPPAPAVTASATPEASEPEPLMAPPLPVLRATPVDENEAEAPNPPSEPALRQPARGTSSRR